MHCHQLTFTPAEAQLLREQFGILKRFLEAGNVLPPAGHQKLTETLRHALLNQEGLQGFWHKTKHHPLDHHHLHLTDTDKELVNLPWLLAIDENKYPYFHVTKGVPDSNVPTPYLPPPGPLKILVMISSPGDLEATHRLSYEAEEEAILQALGPLWEKGQVQVDFTADGSLQSLETQLATQYYHILYFSGHGVYANNTGYLLLENTITLKQEAATAEQLARTLKSKPEHIPPLVVLASCQTGQGNAASGFRGVADELIHYGLPAVIAMAFSVSDHYATVFAGGLYEALAKREPLPRAYHKALKGMRQAEQEYLQHHNQPHAPCQWLIPQLYCSQEVQQIVDWAAPVQPIKVSSGGLIKGDHFSFLSLHEHYRFIGRRRECARFFSRLLNNEPILITGQGGVGKTTMAEHLVKRLITHDPQYHYFAFNETGISILEMIRQVQQYLERVHHLYDIGTTLVGLDKATDQMDRLLRVLMEKNCKPIWVFDNMETCQESIAGPIKPEYTDWLEYIQSRLLTGNFPVIFTGRYPIVELPAIYTSNLNQVRYPDFYRKCLQLDLQKMSGIHLANNVDGPSSISLSLSEIAYLLQITLGGSYRALEFFNEVYKEAPTRTLILLHQLQAAQRASDQEQEKSVSKALTVEVQERLANNSKRLVFGELLALLDEDTIFTLQLLGHFHRPVLPSALEMQSMDKDYDKALQKLRNITLIEEHEEVQAIPREGGKLTYFYATPLVKHWLEDKKLPVIEFSDDVAGEYYENVSNQVSNAQIEDLQEAFRHYGKSCNVNRLNSTGCQLARFYYGRSLFQQSLYYAAQVEKRIHDKIDPELMNVLGLVHQLHGAINKALVYYEKSLFQYQQTGDQKGESSTLVYISQALQTIGDNDKALGLLQQSLAINQAIGNLSGVGDTLNSIGHIYHAQGNYDTAFNLFQQSLVINQAIGDRDSESSTLNNIGQVHQARGDYDAALDFYLKCRTIKEISGDKKGLAIVLNNISHIHQVRGNYNMALDFLQQSLKIKQAIGDRRGESTTLGNIGEIYQSQGDYNIALNYYQKSLVIHQAIGDRRGQGVSLNNIGQIYQRRGNYDTALGYLEQSLTFSQKIGDRDLESTILNNIGQIHQDRAYYDTALDCFQKSLEISQALGDRRGEGSAIGNIGHIHFIRGNYESALALFQESLAISQMIGDVKAAGTLLNNISQIHQAKGDYDTALLFLQKSLAISQAIGDKNGEGITLSNIGNIYEELGDFNKALVYLDKGLVMVQTIGDQQGESTILNNIAHVYQTSGDYNAALDFYQKSLVISQAIGDRKAEVTTLNNLGHIVKVRGNYDTALGFYNRSLSISQDIGDRKGEGTVLNNIGQIYQTWEEYDIALAFFQKSLVICQAIGNRQGEGTLLNDIGMIHRAKSDYETALDFYHKSLAICQSIGDQQGEGTALNNIGQIYHAQGDYDTALMFLPKSLEIRQAINDRPGEATTLNNLAAIAWQKGDYALYSKNMQQAFIIFTKLKDVRGMYYSGKNLGDFFCMCKDPKLVEIGLALLKQAYDVGMQLKFPGVEEVAALIQKYSAADGPDEKEKTEPSE
jgi:tetratricopeptide (TPR) repeat protein